ncbi:MAG: hydroxyisourate hydrolase [Woeseiaceae bacterium]|nr:hydroxyisourate hydrolase [Woeseiaceae bacterium]
MGRLTTHVLDTAGGVPAARVCVRLYTLGETRKLVTTASTNANGRTDSPLLDGDALETGAYELEFDVGNYFRERGNTLAEPAFLDTVVLRFSLRGDEHYHVPLLVSPWSYSTYRGS